MHPMLKPALRRGWRDRQNMQFGVSAAHAVVVGPVDTATGSFLGLLDGTRGLPLLRREAEAMGLGASRVDELVERLGAAGLLDDATAAGGPPGMVDPDQGDRWVAQDRGGRSVAQDRGDRSVAQDRAAAWDRLRPDLASLSVVHPEPGGAMRRMSARAAIRVQVRGAGRVGAAVAAALSASGVGQVDVMDGGCVEPWDVAPSGLPPESVGERRSVAARRVVRAAAPGRRPRRPGPDAAAAAARAAGTAGAAGPFAASGTATALVVLAPRDGLAAYAPDPVIADELIASGVPHLYAGVIEGTGVVGPLVLPGGSACAGCLALERAEREPAWPRMLAQWRSGRSGSGVMACDTALATVVAGLAASHALSFLDGRLPLSAGARLEFALPDLPWEARPVAPHAACRCGAARAADADTSAGESPSAGESASAGESPRAGESPSARDEPHGTMAGRPPSAAWLGG
ncbi:ThiF family adenylyltransferase [Streptomyces sp. 8N616]|uniref:ThiF family adenylyltransferase n=1 Tax=Streptomyces sp. 8N616 TaxID=3457414 RepID=UPI003FD55E3A